MGIKKREHTNNFGKTSWMLYLKFFLLIILNILMYKPTNLCDF